MIKTLIASGCSFTEGNSWPSHIHKFLPDIEVINSAMASQGNGHIARKAQWCIAEYLQAGNSPQDLMVGIVWSGPTRWEWFFEEKFEADNIDGWCPTTGNPHQYIPDATGTWFIGNHLWESGISEKFYSSDYFNVTWAQIRTYEYILATQSFLKSLGIKYFMTNFNHEVFLPTDDTNLNISWMRKLIDWDNWLPCESLFTWVYDNTELPWPDNHGPLTRTDYMHPSPEQHAEFTQHVVVPFLQDKGWA